MLFMNRKTKKRILPSLFLIAVSVFLAGCATKLNATFERPAELDLQGANKIAVVPFQTSDKVSYTDYHNDRGDRFEKIAGFITDLFRPSPSEGVQNEISSYLTAGLVEKLIASKYFTVVNSDEILRAINKGKDIPTDVYLSGRIENLKTKVNEDKTKIQKKNSAGKIYYETKWSYTKNVSATISYSVISASDNRIIASRSKSIHETSGAKSRRKDLPDQVELIKPELNSLISQIMQELKPYTVARELKLLKNKKHEKMKTADQLAKEGNFDDAYRIYKEIYDSTGLFEAGYDEAQILFAQKKLNDAKTLMEELARKTGDTRAFYSLDLIKEEISYAQKVSYQKELREKNKPESDGETYINDAK